MSAMYPGPVDPAAVRGWPGEAGGAERARDRLARLLRTGPFEDALRAAVAASGLSLDRIQDRLKRRGARISVATLSFWQCGRSQPERPSSLRALAELEDILGVPPKSLSALIGPPRPRGRPTTTADSRGLAAGSELFATDMNPVLRGVDTRWDEVLTRLSSHYRLELDEHRRGRRVYNRRLLRAEVDGPDRWIAGCQLADTQHGDPEPPPTLRVEPPHRIGTVVEDPDAGLLLAEVLFDRPLRRGEIVSVEYTHEFRTTRSPTTVVEAALHTPVREYLMEVRFDPSALPASCYSFRTTELDSDAQPQERLLTPDAIGSVLAVALSTGPCHLGIRWDWGD
jgi:transcriptional regulator with XRE-family HTH domain